MTKLTVDFVRWNTGGHMRRIGLRWNWRGGRWHYLMSDWFTGIVLKKDKLP